MIVDDIMSTKLVSVTPDDNLWTVKALFEETGFHHLLVIKDQKLAGILSDRDFFKAASPRIDTAAETAKDAETLNQKVQRIMSPEVITLSPGADVYDAINVFNTNKISCIPIIDQQKKPVGIVSWRDILLAVAKTRKNPGAKK